MKKITLLFSLLIICNIITGQEKIKIYNPEADAKAEIKTATLKARAQKKHVLLQIGGNWCPWCIKLHKFIQDHPVIDSLIKADYEIVRVNYDTKNRNNELMQQLEFPQRFGFPVLVILDGYGKRLHTQSTAYLEKDKSYDIKKVKEFLMQWNKAALEPDTYKK